MPQYADLIVAMGIQTHQGQQHVNTLAQLGLAHTIDAPEKVQVLRCCERRVQRYFLGRKTDHPANEIWFLARAMIEQYRISA
jgi:hypothetical protein